MKLYASEDITIQTFDDSEAKKKNLAQIFPYSAPGSKERIKELQEKGAGIYFATNPQQSSLTRGIKFTTRFQYLTLDLDVAKEKDNLEVGEITRLKDELLAVLTALPLPPYGAMITKNGLQPVWKFSNPQDLPDVDSRLKVNFEYEAMVKAVTMIIGHKSEGDSICRVIRLPGLLHLKTPTDPYKITYKEISGKECTFEEFNEAYPPTQEFTSKFDPSILDGVEDGHRTESAGSYIGHKLENLKRLDDKSTTTAWAEIRDWNKFKNPEPKNEDELKDYFEDILGKEKSKRLGQDEEAVAPKTPWPSPLNEAAFNGIAGKFVKLVEPHSEADPAYLLTGFLAAFGSVVGDKPYFQVERTKHKLKLFVVHVGSTSRGRKGTAWDQVRPIFDYIDPLWSKNIVNGGLATGEGLINAVRDSITKIRDGQEIVLEDGVKDKRLLVIEPEFSSVLKVMSREHNILSPILRSAWDRGDLRTLTKTSPLKATGSHVSLIGHIVQEELLRCLNSTEMANGFGNRILFFMGKRSKKLPFGGTVPYMELDKLTKDLTLIFDRVKDFEEITFNDEARELWVRIYSDLTDEESGIVGSMSARIEPYTLRLACLYALLDESDKIKIEHLRAAIAVVDYYYESIIYLFGHLSGNPLIEKILETLGQDTNGMTKTEISFLFSRNKSSEEISTSLDYMESKGLVKVVQNKTSGRPTNTYYLNSLNSFNSLMYSSKNYLKRLDGYIKELSFTTPSGTTNEKHPYEINEINEKTPDVTPADKEDDGDWLEA